VKSQQPVFRAPKTESLPPVFLNHFYVVLDSVTYRAIEEDMFLRKHFAINEGRTTVRADQTYTGLYFYGTNTYFEFFDVANSPRPRVGDSGIAFGVDHPGAIEDLMKTRRLEFEPDLKLVTRFFQNNQVPWFHMATPKSLPYEGGMSSWVMEYHPEFLANWHPKPNETNRSIRRRDILKRYSEVLEPINGPCLEDVTGLTLAVDGPTTGSLRHFCLQLGYRIERREDGFTELHGSDFFLLLIPGTENVRGIREVTMRTRNLPRGERWRQLGNCMLSFNAQSVIWSFH
jgi:hypothetical protein